MDEEVQMRDFFANDFIWDFPTKLDMWEKASELNLFILLGVVQMGIKIP